jgi:hypothetical protein
MAKLTEYRSKTPASIPGLPDTTNITDPQLRLFLDRIKLFCSDLAVTVSNIQRYNDINNIATDLMGSDIFNSMIESKITQTAKPIVDDSITQNNNRQDKNKNKNIKLTGLEVDPDSINIAINGSNTKNVYERYIPGNTSDQYRGVTWSSSDANIATVDENGIVTAVAIGECEVIATSVYDKKITASATVTVAEATTITVEASYSWATGAYADAVFTEEASPGSGDCVWNGTSNVVTVFQNQSEAEAKADSALTLVKSADNRDYIVADNKRYWRDEDNDKVSGSKPISIFKGTIAGRSHEYGDHIVWFEQNEYWTGKENGKRIFSDASASSDISDSEKANYTAEKLEIGVTNWQDPYPDHFPWSLYEACDEDGNSLIPYAGYGYMVPTGNSTTLTPPDGYYWFDFGLGDDFDGKFYEYKTFDGKFTAWCTKFYNQSGGLVAAYPSKPYFEKNEGDFWSILPLVEASNGHHLRSLSSYEKPVTAINGLYYDSIRNPSLAERRYVWDFDIAYAAWSLSPCKGDETIYTETETPSAGVSFGTVADDTFTVTGTVSATGSGVYSITGNNGSTYYYNG